MSVSSRRSWYQTNAVNEWNQWQLWTAPIVEPVMGKARPHTDIYHLAIQILSFESANFIIYNISIDLCNINLLWTERSKYTIVAIVIQSKAISLPPHTKRNKTNNTNKKTKKTSLNDRKGCYSRRQEKNGLKHVKHIVNYKKAKKQTNLKSTKQTQKDKTRAKYKIWAQNPKWSSREWRAHIKMKEQWQQWVLNVSNPTHA